MRRLRSVSRVWQSITLEPTVALYYIAADFIAFLDTNMLLQKSCRFNETVEPDLSTPCDDEQYGQLYTAGVNSWRNTVRFYMEIVVVILASVWSDNRGKERRHLIYAPVIAQFLHAIFGASNAYFWRWHPDVLAVGTPLIPGCSGGMLAVMLGSHLYISSITSISQRTVRLGFLVSLSYICAPFGSGLSGYVNTSFGFTKAYLLCAVLAMAGLLIGRWKIIKPPLDDKAKMDALEAISPGQVFKSFSILWKKRPGHRRLVLLCTSILDPLVVCSLLGEQTVTYLYFRYRFGWQEKAYSVYTAYKMLGTLFGTMFCTVYMSKYLKIHDGFIGTLAAFWDTVGNISYFFADQAWELYVIPLYNIFNGVLFAMMASLSTKCVEPNEMGYLTSVRSLMQIVSPLSFPLYGLVYRTTLDVLPQAFFLLSVLFNFPTIILFGIAYYLSKDIVFETPDTSVTAAVDNTTTPPAVNPAAAVTDGLPHHQNGEMKKSIES